MPRHAYTYRDWNGLASTPNELLLYHSRDYTYKMVYNGGKLIDAVYLRY
jgi:hypothetical protein